MDTEQQQTELQNTIFILKLVMSFLQLVQEESSNYAFLELTKYCIENWKCNTYYLANFKPITLRTGLVSIGNLVGIKIISRYSKCLSVKKS